MSARHPVRCHYGEAMQTQMMMLLSNQENVLNVARSHGYTGRIVLGYKVPDWQRDPCWSIEQCRRFIESVWLGVSLSTFMVNESEINEFDIVLLDGQQRLTALDRYWKDEFSILGEDGKEYFWSQLEQGEQAQMLRIPFPWVKSHYNNERDMKDAYNRHNFGGTPHEKSERA